MVPIKTISMPGMNCQAVAYGRLFLGIESMGESSVMMFVLAPQNFGTLLPLQENKNMRHGPNNA